MAEQTPEQRIAQLEAENAALRAATGILHPPVQPKFFNGSLVVYQGEHHRVIGRSIAQDGTCTYTLAPATFDMVPVDLRDPAGAQTAGNIQHHETERIFDVAEADLEPLDATHLSKGKHVPPEQATDAKSDAAAASEAVDIQRE